MRCSFCRSWVPHYHYSFVGFCVETKEIVFDDQVCEEFEHRTLEGEFLWCTVCKCEVSVEELEYHVSREHRLCSSVYLDWDYREEIYEG